jgi:Pyruvate/2-oxoglutarate dehydrogenase complex, dihydrolipoamide acyltransferase (E2) component, and related enzymes
MSEKILVPTLGESVTEATVSKWLKNQGEKVVADEPIVELETDKVNVEVPAPSDGILERISVKEGETVNVGALLGMINGSAKEILKNPQDVKDYSPPKKKTKVLKKSEEETFRLFEEKEKKEEEPLKLETEEALVLDNVHEEKKVKKIQKPKNQEPSVSPAARKMAAESKVDLNKIEGSGKNGVILKEDIMSLMGSKPSPSERKIKHGPKKE